MMPKNTIIYNFSVSIIFIDNGHMEQRVKGGLYLQ